MGYGIKNTPAKAAPEGVEEGLTPAIFNSMALVNHPDWAGPGKFGYDDGERLHWSFTLVDENEQPLYDDGDVIEIEAVNSATLNTKSDKSKNAAWLKAVSPVAFAAVDAGTEFDSEEMDGAPCYLLLEIKENGWPKVVNVIPRKRAKKAKPAPVAADTTVDEE
jgi:hypothetical protein